MNDRKQLKSLDADNNLRGGTEFTEFCFGSCNKSNDEGIHAPSSPSHNAYRMLCWFSAFGDEYNSALCWSRKIYQADVSNIIPPVAVRPLTVLHFAEYQWCILYQIDLGSNTLWIDSAVPLTKSPGLWKFAYRLAMYKKTCTFGIVF